MLLACARARHQINNCKSSFHNLTLTHQKPPQKQPCNHLDCKPATCLPVGVVSFLACGPCLLDGRMRPHAHIQPTTDACEETTYKDRDGQGDASLHHNQRRSPMAVARQAAACAEGGCSGGDVRRRLRNCEKASQLSNIRSPMRRKVSCTRWPARAFWPKADSVMRSNA